MYSVSFNIIKFLFHLSHFVYISAPVTVIFIKSINNTFLKTKLGCEVYGVGAQWSGRVIQ
jgi:hypothetical protein